MNSGRSVVSLRLSNAEKEPIDAAARKQRIRASEFLRQAALLVAHRLAEAARPKPKPRPQPVVQPVDDGPARDAHVFVVSRVREPRRLRRRSRYRRDRRPDYLGARRVSAGTFYSIDEPGLITDPALRRLRRAVQRPARRSGLRF
jgi:hypothetical protein